MEKEKNEDVEIEVGQVIDISLESMMGSTGYGWELSELTGPLRLIGISVIPSSTEAVAPVTQVFHIKGTGIGKAKVKFVLTAAWKLEEPIQTVSYQIKVTEAKKPVEDDLKIKGYVASPKATVREQASVIPPYAAQPPMPDYGIPCSDLWQRYYYGVLPQNLGASDPRLYYGVCCSPQASNLVDTRMYYGVRCAPTADPRFYYGVCCAPESDECGTPPIILKYGIPSQIYKYGILPRPLYNVNSPFAKYNIPPVMRYNFPDKCE